MDILIIVVVIVAILLMLDNRNPQPRVALGSLADLLWLVILLAVAILLLRAAGVL